MNWWGLIVNEEFFAFKMERQEAYNIGLGFLLLTVVGFLRYRRLSKDQRRIFIFAAYSLLMEYISSDKDWMVFLNSNGNTRLYHLLTPGLFAALAWVFIPFFYPKKPWIWWVTICTFILNALVGAFLLGNIDAFPTWTASAYGLSGMFFCFAYMLHLLQTLTVSRLELDPLFWFAASGLIYYSGSVLFLVGMNSITFERNFFNSIYNILRFLLVFFQFALLVALLLPQRPGRPNHPGNLS